MGLHYNFCFLFWNLLRRSFFMHSQVSYGFFEFLYILSQILFRSFSSTCFLYTESCNLYARYIQTSDLAGILHAPLIMITMQCDAIKFLCIQTGSRKNWRIVFFLALWVLWLGEQNAREKLQLLILN